MSRVPRAFVSVTNDLYTDNRVDKICAFLTDQGFEVELIGRIRPESPSLEPRRYRTHRFRLPFDKGPFFYAAYNIRLFLYLLVRRSELLVANDLDTLLANYLVTRFKPKTRLVYDSHEFFTEVPELVNRPKVQRIWQRIERLIFPKLDTIYTVNGSIAKRYEELYHKKVRVVRNISPLWNPSHRASRKDLGIPEDKFILIIQGAGINIDRGAEEAIEALRRLEDVVLIIVGDGDVLPQLKKNVKEYELQNKVLFFGKRPYRELMQFTALADVGLTLDKPTNLNYRFSLPNKVFDYIHATTPIICSDLPEVTKVVNENKVGLVLSDYTVDALVEAVNELKGNKDLYHQLKENCRIAAKKESWEGECEVLKEIYPKVERE